MEHIILFACIVVSYINRFCTVAHNCTLSVLALLFQVDRTSALCQRILRMAINRLIYSVSSHALI